MNNIVPTHYVDYSSETQRNLDYLEFTKSHFPSLLYLKEAAFFNTYLCRINVHFGLKGLMLKANSYYTGYPEADCEK